MILINIMIKVYSLGVFGPYEMLALSSMKHFICLFWILM